MKLEDYSIISWIYEQKIKTETGDSIDLRDHLFLFDIYKDFSPKQVCYKAAQVGFSTLAILKSFWITKNKKIDSIYTLPTFADVNDFAGGKINRIIQQNPILQKWVKDRDTVEQKRVGDNIIYYRGTFTEKSALMISSDLNIHDEEDRSKQDIIQQYSSRQQHSAYKWEWHFSNPSVEGNGVSRYWKKSDQKHWFIKCKGCSYRQFLSWPDSIDIKRGIYICKKCGKEVDRSTRRVGKWVQKFKDKEYSGYWINLMMAPWVSAEDIINYKNTKSAEYFYNFVLGLPYIGQGNKVTPDILFRNLTNEINSQEDVVIGCDSGLQKHYVLGNREGLFYYGVTETWEDIESMLKRFKRSVAVIDALPDLTEPRKLREKYPGRVFLCHYSRDRKTMQFVRWGEKKDYGNVVADRERMIQLVVDEFADGRIPLQGNQDDWMDYYSHWDTMYRINEWEEAQRRGNKGYVYSSPYRWESSTGNDHWAHATVFWRVGMNKFGKGKAMIMQDRLEFEKGVEIGVKRDTEQKISEIFSFPKPEEEWRNI